MGKADKTAGDISQSGGSVTAFFGFPADYPKCQDKITKNYKKFLMA